MDLKQTTMIRLGSDDVAGLHLSVPAWDALSKPPANRGFVRHGCVRQAVSYLLAGMKVEYGVHAQPFNQAGTTHLLLWGTRNTMQNMLLPAWKADSTPQLLRRADEPWQSTTYHAFLRRRDSSSAIEEVRFVAEHGLEPDAIQVLRDGVWVAGDDVVWAVVGQPVLWDGQLPPLNHLAARTYDLRHIWRLHWEEHDDKSGVCARDAAIHAELMGLFMDTLTASVETRGALLGGVAVEHGLTVEDGYLHSSMGLDAEGNIVLLAKHGSLHDIGDAQRSAGARRAILLDNGGSVGYAYSVPGEQLRLMGNGSYFRPPGHAVIVAVLSHGLVEGPFRQDSRSGFDAAAILRRPTLNGDTFVDAVGRDLRLRTAMNADIVFDGPYGLTRLSVPRLPGNPQADAVCAEYAAATINNHAMLLGVRGAHILADDGFVHAVQRSFKRRLDQVAPGTGIESGCVSDYLGVFNDQPFEIRRGSADLLLALANQPQASAQVLESGNAVPDRLAIGIDIGSGHTKLVLMRGACELRRTGFSTRNHDGPTTTQYLLSGIRTAADQMCAEANVPLADVACVGVTWPGAVRDNRIAGSSNLFREMDDLRGQHGKLNLDAVNTFRDLANLVKDCLGLNVPVRLINDGNALAYFLARKQAMRDVLFVQLGTSIAGGYVDHFGNSDYLAELSRFVLDLAADAPVHTFTKITGLSRQVASGAALKRLMVDAGVEDVDGIALTRFNPGEFASAVLGMDSSRGVAKHTRQVVETVGRNLGRFLVSVAEHLPFEHVLVSGGLVSSSRDENNQVKENRLVQPLLGAAWQELHGACPKVSLNVVEVTAGSISFKKVEDVGDTGSVVDRHLGAMAAADYAIHSR